MVFAVPPLHPVVSPLGDSPAAAEGSERRSIAFGGIWVTVGQSAERRHSLVFLVVATTLCPSLCLVLLVGYSDKYDF